MKLWDEHRMRVVAAVVSLHLWRVSGSPREEVLGQIMKWVSVQVLGQRYVRQLGLALEPIWEQEVP